MFLLIFYFMQPMMIVCQEMMDLYILEIDLEYRLKHKQDQQGMYLEDWH